MPSLMATGSPPPPSLGASLDSSSGSLGWSGMITPRPTAPAVAPR